jgi:hypothetical protein
MDDKGQNKEQYMNEEMSGVLKEGCPVKAECRSGATHRDEEENNASVQASIAPILSTMGLSSTVK